MSTPKPSPLEALTRAESLLGKGTYFLGTGGYRGKDTPWTDTAGAPHLKDACDCWGLVSWAFCQPRTMRGYNAGGATVQDAVNVDSAIEDACGIRNRPPRKALWTNVDFKNGAVVALGDLLVWPSIYVTTKRVKDGSSIMVRTRPRIGHVAIIAHAPQNWQGEFAKLEVIQCGGRNGTHPAITKISGQAWQNCQTWRGETRPQWGARILRAV